MLISMGLSISVGLLDGLGLAMFLPLLRVASGEGAAAEEGLGNLSFLVDAMESLGIGLTITSVLMVMLFFFVLKGIAKFIEAVYKLTMSQYFSRKIWLENIASFTNFKYKSFVSTDVGRIQNTLGAEIHKVMAAYTAYFNAMQNVIMVVVYTFLAFVTNPQFALLVLIGGMLSNAVYRGIYRKTKEESRKITKYGHSMVSLLTQKIMNYKYLKATAFIYPYADRMRQVLYKSQEASRKIGMYNAILTASKEPIVVAVVVMVIIIQIQVFSASLAPIILSLLFFYRSLTFLMVLQNQWNQFMNHSGAMENMTSFVKELKEGKEQYGKRRIERLENQIELRQADFFYGETQILKNINLRIARNQTIAFVGESGSGKTTLVNMLAGLMKTDKGEMLVDGVSANELYTPSYQRRIGYITQEPVIFADTVFNNVTFWAEKTPENLARFYDALRKASIDEFIKTLPKKEEALLGHNGILISGGQKQRISIAREIYKDVDILIMDEATSALDSETERTIQTNIDRLKGQYTILIVAHRLATIKNADQVILLKGGKIDCVGNFEELKIASPAFEKMVELQEV